MRTKIALTPDVSLRGTPSLYHAHFAGLLEMPDDEFMRFLRQRAEENPCLEVQAGQAAYVLDAGRISIRKDVALNGASHGVTASSRGTPPGDMTQDDLDDLSRHYDFTESLSMYLTSQMPSPSGRLERKTLETIIEFIDDRGFLGEDPDVISSLSGVSREEIAEALEAVKAVPPGGIGSRDLCDFLWFQCRETGWDTPPMRQLVFDLLGEVGRNNLSKIQRGLSVGEKKARRMVQVLKDFRPYPTWGMDFQSPADSAGLQSLTPDFAFREYAGGICLLEVREPGIRVQGISLYREPGPLSSTAGGADPETAWNDKARVLEKEAKELQEAVARRGQVLLRVVAAVVDLQKEWLLDRKDYLEPLEESELAQRLAIPLSTISRALKGRHISCPRGTYPLKHLFARRFSGSCNGAISRDFILQTMAMLERGARGENISDMQMVRLLQGYGIHIARRTVNKYRNRQSGF